MSIKSPTPLTVNKARVRRGTWVLIPAALLSVGGAGTMAVREWMRAVTLSVDFVPMKFDAEQWRTSPPEHSWDSVRLRMVDDLLRSGQLAGMSRQATETLLGAADDTNYFPSFDLVYRLGAERHPFAVDSEWLLIKLGQDGRVESSSIGRD